jgi:hypothetical protein
VKRISFPSAATLAIASGIAAWEGMERNRHILLVFYCYYISREVGGVDNVPLWVYFDAEISSQFVTIWDKGGN